MKSLLTPLFAAATVLAFILTMISADLGASENNILTAICAVAVLGASTFMTVIEGRLP